MLSDKSLTEELYSFMKSIPDSWNWDKLNVLNETRELHKEYRGPENKESLIFTLEVLEKDEKNGKEYLHMLVDVSDVDRGIKFGSSYRPLVTSFLWYKNGEIDMPTENDIYLSFNKD